MVLVWCKRSGRTAPTPPINGKELPFPKKNCSIFHSSTMTVAPMSVLCFNFETNAGIKYSIESNYPIFLDNNIFLRRKWRFWTLIESNDLFLEIIIIWKQKSFKSGLPVGSPLLQGHHCSWCRLGLLLPERLEIQYKNYLEN